MSRAPAADLRSPRSPARSPRSRSRLRRRARRTRSATSRSTSSPRCASTTARRRSTTSSTRPRSPPSSSSSATTPTAAGRSTRRERSAGPARSLLGEISSGLELTANGRTVPLGAPRGPASSASRPGQGGLVADPGRGRRSRPRCPAGAQHVELANGAFSGPHRLERDPDPARRGDRRPLERPRHRPHRRPARLPAEPPVEPARRPRGELRR